MEVAVPLSGLLTSDQCKPPSVVRWRSPFHPVRIAVCESMVKMELILGCREKSVLTVNGTGETHVRPSSVVYSVMPTSTSYPIPLGRIERSRKLLRNGYRSE